MALKKTKTSLSVNKLGAQLIAVFGVFCLLGSSVLAQEGSGKKRLAWDWLSEVAKAADGLSYSGTFVYTREGALESMTIDHGVKNGVPVQRLAGMGALSREIIEDENSVACVLPDKRMGIRETRRDMPSNQRQNKLVAFELIKGDISQIKQNYSIAVLAVSEVAGRTCQNVQISAKDVLRYGYLLCVDLETFLPLKSVMLGVNGKAIETQMFTQITFGDTTPKLSSSVPSASLEWFNEEAVQDGVVSNYGRQVQQKSLDDMYTQKVAGFEVVHALRRNSPALGKEIRHLILSDGLANVSVFILPSLDQGIVPSESGKKMGGVNSYSRITSEHKVIALGEVPFNTVKLLVKSFSAS